MHQRSGEGRNVWRNDRRSKAAQQTGFHFWSMYVTTEVLEELLLVDSAGSGYLDMMNSNVAHGQLA